MAHRYPRLLTLLLAAIQFAMPAFVSVSDGAFAKLVRDQGSHVESSGDSECVPPHQADCTVCRYLSDHGSDTPGRASLIASDSRAPHASSAVPHGSFVDELARSRAPPAA